MQSFSEKAEKGQSACASEFDVRFSVTVYEPQSPVGKRIDKGADGHLIKGPSKVPHDGRAVLRTVASLAEFMEVRAAAHALSYGTFAQAETPLTTTRRPTAGRYARTKDNVHWPAGRGLCMIDYDPVGEVLEPHALHAALIQAVPELAPVTMAWAASASSFIVDSATGHTLVGLKGQRLYFVLEEAGEAPHVIKAIHQRLVLIGRGHVLIDGTGGMHIRSLVDACVGQPERVDFAKVRVGPGLEHRPPKPLFFGGGCGDLGLDVALPAGALRPLSGAALEAFERAEHELKAEPATVARAAEVRDQWAECKALEANPKATPEELAALKLKLLKGIGSGTLYEDVLITLEFGNVVSVGDVLADPDRYENLRCYDPAEPADSGRDERAAVFQNARDGSGLILYTHLHHGIVYRLDRLGFEDVVGDESETGRRQRQRAMNASLQHEDISTLPPQITVDEMLKQCVFIAEGSQVGFRHTPRRVLSFSDFSNFTASCETEVDDEPSPDKTKVRKPAKVRNAVLWRKAAHRQTVQTITFHPGAGAICRDPDGKEALNTWQPIARWESATDITPFLDQVRYLFADESGAFMDWLAHLEQSPGVLPHYGWLHIAKHTGTGRNWMASLFARLWRGYVAPNVDLHDLLSSQFNGVLAGRVLAIVDEVREGGREDYRHAERLKSLVNAEKRKVNPKFGREHTEHNACRWLTFSNHDSALPLNDTDRRWRVARHDAPPRDAGAYTTLYAALEDADFVNAVGVFLADRDISGFNPGARPPMTAAKRAAVSASKPLLMLYAEELVRMWPCDLITNFDAVRELAPDAEHHKGLTAAMRRALEEAGAVQWAGKVKIDGEPHRGWILRNATSWAEGRGVDIAEHILSARRGR